MKFGVREICDVVLKAKAAQKIGSKVFYKNEPVIYFDSLKTSSLEGQSTTVYAQGGRGNSRLIGWDGERTVTFTMEDALISPMGISILTGAGLIDASENNSIKMHTTERTDRVSLVWADGVADAEKTSSNIDHIEITLSEAPYIPGAVVDPTTGAYTFSNTANDTASKNLEDFIYVMLLKNDEPYTEPFIPSEVSVTRVAGLGGEKDSDYVVSIYKTEAANSGYSASSSNLRKNSFADFDAAGGNIVLVDYYIERESGAFEIDITPDKFGGNFYLEASTLFRDTNGVDMPAEFIIPNCKVQSNFTFTMASSGDPSTFTFTMDAFPDYTRWNKTKKVLAAIQVLDTSTANAEAVRPGTAHDVNTAEWNKQRPFIEV